jgi:hypothetical protein
MNDKEKSEEIEDEEIEDDEIEDKEIFSKKYFTVKDIKGAVLNDQDGTGGKFGISFLETIAIIVFSLLLFVTGVFLTVFTFYTGIGLIVGIVVMIAAVAIPFIALGRGYKK